MMFHKILIANRGEIACRIIRTARQMGIRSVAIYSDADSDALHTRLADEAYRVGPALAEESYLNIETILHAARESGAEAIHPGYGFLAENADFVAACKKAGLVFVGPSPESISAMGDKSRAKQLMEQAGVPLIPGYHGTDQQLKMLQQQAKKIGFPLLIKACSGGGGKGMRLVERAGDFAEALEAAKRESQASFGEQRVLLGKYLVAPRHIEIQIFADQQGNVLHLFERDCSMQRRQQKVIEEAPAPGLAPKLRTKIGAAATAAARAINYVGAGTVEFLLDGSGAFYFMEMNTRLQVEHPVTEMITARDLVEWQLRVSAGTPLPCNQEELSIRGHAIEARIYAEDPAHEFQPATGTIKYLQQPQEGEHVRFDSGIAQGDRIRIHYDPLLAKLIVWGQDRDAAVRCLQGALNETRIVGVTTNLDFLSHLATQPGFVTGDYNTTYIEQHCAQLRLEAQPPDDSALALACLTILLKRDNDARLTARGSCEPDSPWHRTDGWRLNSDNQHQLQFLYGEEQLNVIAHFRHDGYLLKLLGRTLLVRGEVAPTGELLADLEGTRFNATVICNEQDLTVYWRGRKQQFTQINPYAPLSEPTGKGNLTAPMPGRIVEVLAAKGSLVKEGSPLVILEAMKMQQTISAPRDGRIAEVHFTAGDLVEEGTVLLAFKAEEGER